MAAYLELDLALILHRRMVPVSSVLEGQGIWRQFHSAPVGYRDTFVMTKLCLVSKQGEPPHLNAASWCIVQEVSGYEASSSQSTATIIHGWSLVDNGYAVSHLAKVHMPTVWMLLHWNCHQYTSPCKCMMPPSSMCRACPRDFGARLSPEAGTTSRQCHPAPSACCASKYPPFRWA